MRHFHANRLGKLQVIVHGYVVVPGDVSVTAGRLQHFLRIAEDGKLVNQEDVRSQVGDASSEIHVHPVNQRNHQDERRNRQNNAQQHEERPQLVGAHRLQRDNYRLTQEMLLRKSPWLRFCCHGNLGEGLWNHSTHHGQVRPSGNTSQLARKLHVGGGFPGLNGPQAVFQSNLSAALSAFGRGVALLGRLMIPAADHLQVHLRLRQLHPQIFHRRG